MGGRLLNDVARLLADLEETQAAFTTLFQRKRTALKRPRPEELLDVAHEETALADRLQQHVARRAQLLHSAGRAGLRNGRCEKPCSPSADPGRRRWPHGWIVSRQPPPRCGTKAGCNGSSPSEPANISRACWTSSSTRAANPPPTAAARTKPPTPAPFSTPPHDRFPKPHHPYSPARDSANRLRQTRTP